MNMERKHISPKEKTMEKIIGAGFKRWPSLGAAALALAFTAQAGEPEFYECYGIYDWKVRQFYNFDVTPGTGQDFELFYRSGVNATPDKHIDYILENKTTTGACYEVTAGPPNPAQPTGKVIHMQFWVFGQPNQGWTDMGGHLENKMRVYLNKGSVGLNMSMLNDGSGKNYFILNLMRKNLGESDCTSGQAAINWYKNINGTQTWKKIN
jgi:hypothetical protein